jgi:thioredoxin-like negative regulator of GroEL
MSGDMARVAEISDWQLADELAAERPVLGVGYVSRLDARHGDLLSRLKSLSMRYGDSAAFFVVDVAENPSLVPKFGFRTLPALVLYASGAEFRRWEGAVDLGAVTDAVDILLRTQEGIE